jgi:hypothetical protein
MIASVATLSLVALPIVAIVVRGWNSEGYNNETITVVCRQQAKYEAFCTEPSTKHEQNAVFPALFVIFFQLFAKNIVILFAVMKTIVTFAPT